MKSLCPNLGIIVLQHPYSPCPLGFKSQMLLSKDVGLGVDAVMSVDIEPSIGKAAIGVFDKMPDEGAYIVGEIYLLTYQYC